MAIVVSSKLVYANVSFLCLAAIIGTHSNIVRLGVPPLEVTADERQKVPQ